MGLEDGAHHDGVSALLRRGRDIRFASFCRVRISQEDGHLQARRYFSCNIKTARTVISDLLASRL